MRQRLAGCLVIIIICAMCMTGTSLPSINFGDSGNDTSIFEDMDMSFDRVPVNEDYAISFKRDASSDAEPSAVQVIASDSGCTWTEDDAQFVVPENTTCLFALASSPDIATQFRLLLSQGDTVLVTLAQDGEVTQGGKSDKPVFRLSYGVPPTPIPSATPTSAATIDPNVTVTPQPTPTTAVGVPAIPTATPSSYQQFQDKLALLTLSECTFFAEPETDPDNPSFVPEARSCVVVWVQGDNTEDVWWKSWVSGDSGVWSGLFTR